MRWTIAPLLLAATLAACGGGGVEQEAAAAMTPADTVATAERAFSPELFDTVAWVADSAAFSRGAVVWTYSCRKCHGDSGRGDGRFVVNGDTVRPPSLLEPAWRFAADRAALRRHIFVGTDAGMPHWGLEGLKPRDIDAVATYILDGLRWGVEEDEGKGEG